MILNLFQSKQFAKGGIVLNQEFGYFMGLARKSYFCIGFIAYYWCSNYDTFSQMDFKKSQMMCDD